MGIWPGGHFRALTHQTDVEEEAVTKADCYVSAFCLCLGRKVSLEHATKTTTLQTSRLMSCASIIA